MSATPHALGEAAAALVHELALRALTLPEGVVVLSAVLEVLLKQVECTDLRRAYAASIVRTVTASLDAPA